MKRLFQKCMKNRRIASFSAAVLSLILMLTGAVQYYTHALPDHLYTKQDTPASVSALLPVTVSHAEPALPHTGEAELRLFGMIPLKTVPLTTFAQSDVWLGGEPFGIRMLMAGAMVVSLSDLPSTAGICCPAAEAGIETGDVIYAVNGERIAGNADLQRIVASSAGKPVRVTFRRAGTELTVAVQPVWNPAASRWQIGLWVRDSTAGIGTVTYYTQSATGAVQFAGLGHAVCDADTGGMLPLASGDVLRVSVSEVIPGSAGVPGELRGTFDTAHSIGTLLANTPSGIFGTMDALPDGTRRIPIGFRQDIRRGAAVICTTLHGTVPRTYDVEIEEIRGNDPALRNMVIRVTDKELLREAGGIVQGMSGSPIIQNGKLIGAVTHVFVKDPTRGYGIFVENMYAQTAALADAKSPAAAAMMPAAGDTAK
ncbi:MAG: SpoIVB peptidase [Oscillospiraceae bacterium]|nr:SpoIVB peptidase [Oscillospiraceae bacterium]